MFFNENEHNSFEIGCFPQKSDQSMIQSVLFDWLAGLVYFLYKVWGREEKMLYLLSFPLIKTFKLNMLVP